METQYQKLGIRTFWVFVLEYSGLAAFIFLLWLFLIIIEGIGIPKVFSFASAYPVIISIINTGFAWGVLIGLLLWIVALLFAFLGAGLDYYGYQFFLDVDALKIKRGVINKDEISIPYRQIANVDVEQTFVHQLLGVSRVAILTAGHEDKNGDTNEDFSEGALPVIEKDKAEEMRDILIKRANVEKVMNVEQK